MPRAITLFLVALTHYTRLPGPKGLPYDPETQHQATILLPMVGIVVGLIAGGIGLLTFGLFSAPIAAIIITLTGVVITGAFHEDGLADSADGLIGGWDKDKRLTIMKDSRVGSFGVLALILAIGLKTALITETLVHFQHESIAILLIITSIAALSRFGALLCRLTANYARPSKDQTAKSALLRQNSDFAYQAKAALCCLPPVMGLAVIGFPPATLLAMTIATMALPFLLQAWITRKIDGYTGDTLGAVQQITEIALLAVIVGGLS